MTDQPSSPPEPPPDLGDAGARLWSSLVVEYEVEAHELPVLAEACRLADMVATLEAAVASDGLMVTGSTGQQRLHPAVSELRQSRATLARMLNSLPWPSGDEGKPMTVSQRQASVASKARWDRVRQRGL